MKKCIACLMPDKVVDFAEVVYRQIPSLTLTASPLSIYKQTESTAGNHSRGWLFFLFMFVGSIVLGGGNQIIWRELYEIWVKNNTYKKAYIIFAYLLINIVCVKDLLVSLMACERWIISSSLLEEVGPLKSHAFGLALFCILPLLLPYVVLEDGVHCVRINGLCQNM